MDLQDTTDDLNDTLLDMRDNSRAVNDSLKVLAEQGVGQLSQVLQKAATSDRDVTRRPQGDIVSSELNKLLRQEIAAGIATVFDGGVLGQKGSGGFSGASGMNVIINNNSNVAVSAQERSDVFNQRYLEITIDQMVANSLLRGRQTSGVMRSLFGLAPTLMGR
jgi:hypothetical protein